MRKPRVGIEFAILGVALGLRLAAAWIADEMATRRGTICLFPDAQVYWQLAGNLLGGEPYVVFQWDVPHFALRTPGFPLFLAACRAAFGDAPWPARLVQVALGVATVAMVGRLALAAGKSRKTALIATALAAVDPFAVGFTALLLSEAVFLPLLVGFLWGLLGLRTRATVGRSLATGVAAGAAVLVKPSFLLFPPLILVVGLVLGPWRPALRGACLVGLGLVLVMAPWWIRNARIYGEFVPTALWGGASLYDGWNPEADGSSEMGFLEADAFRGLDEQSQDRTLNALAWRFAREHPGRVAWLAVVKAGRYWSPWLNAEGFRSPMAMAAGAAWSIPIYALILLGGWGCRREPWGGAVLLGPLLYFAAVHMVFVGSVRYRVPGEIPALVMAAAAFDRWGRRGG